MKSISKFPVFAGWLCMGWSVRQTAGYFNGGDTFLGTSLHDVFMIVSQYPKLMLLGLTHAFYVGSLSTQSYYGGIMRS